MVDNVLKYSTDSMHKTNAMSQYDQKFEATKRLLLVRLYLEVPLKVMLVMLELSLAGYKNHMHIYISK